MKKKLLKILIILTFFIFAKSYAQEFNYTQFQDTLFLRHSDDISEKLIYQTDTILFDSPMQRHYLIGTTVLPWTHNQMSAREYGLYFEKIRKSDCQGNPYEKYVPDKINSIQLSDSSLIIDVNITDNCCYDFLCDIQVDSLGILHLIYNGYGNYCACECCFGLTYYLQIEKSPDYKVINAIMLGDNRKSIKKIEKKN